MLQRIRDKLISRGARGIFGLGKSFRIIDDDNSFTLELSEFKKAMNDYRLGFNEDEIVEMFNVFDINKDKKIQYDEFLRTVRVTSPIITACVGTNERIPQALG